MDGTWFNLNQPNQRKFCERSIFRFESYKLKYLIRGQQDLYNVSNVDQPQNVRVLYISRWQRGGLIAVEQWRQAECERDEDSECIELQNWRISGVDFEQGS